MMRLGLAVILGAALGLAALGQPTPVTLAPAEEEVKALREAWGKVLAVFEEFLVEFKGAVATLNSNDRDLFGKYQALSAQLRDLEAKFLQLQELSSQKIAALALQIDQLSARVGVLESYDIGNLSRRVLSLEQAIQAVQIKIENNREKIAALEKTLGGLTADIAALAQSVLTLEARVSDHDARIASVEETFGTNVQDLTARLDMVQALAVLGLLAGIGAIVLVLLGLGG